MSTAFDTLKYAKQLEEIGIDVKQAEGMSRALAEALETGDLSTKQDLKDITTALHQDMKAMESGIRQDMKDMEIRLLNVLRNQMKWTVGILFLQAGLVVALVKLIPGPSG